MVFGSFFWGLGNPFSFDNERFVHWKNYAMLPILFLMVVNLIKTKKEMIIIVLLMTIVLFLVDYHFYQNVRYMDLSFYRKDLDSGGIFTNLGGNELAAFYAHFMFLALGLFFYEKNKILKIFYIGTAVFTLYPITYLFSRGAYAAVVIGLLYIGLKKSKLILLCLIILFFMWTTVLPDAAIERILMTQTEGGELEDSATLRLDYWILGFKQFLRSPLIGVGFDTSPIFRGGDLHNAYIEILAEQGIIGLWIFMALLYATFRNSVWLHRNANDDFFKGLGFAASSVVVACSVTNLFGDRWTYMELSAFFFVLMALVVKARIMVEDRIKV